MLIQFLILLDLKYNILIVIFIQYYGDLYLRGWFFVCRLLLSCFGTDSANYYENTKW